MTHRPEGWAKGTAPESWCCIDCGFNTAPGFSTRVELEKALETQKRVHQEFNRDSEIYTVHDHVWEAAGMDPWGGCLCIGCLEIRIRRPLRPEDFVPDHPFNSPDLPRTRRLLQRLTGDPLAGVQLTDPLEGKTDQLFDKVDWRSLCKGAAS